jgi:hypothetical protein
VNSLMVSKNKQQMQFTEKYLRWMKESLPIVSFWGQGPEKNVVGKPKRVGYSWIRYAHGRTTLKEMGDKYSNRTYIIISVYLSKQIGCTWELGFLFRTSQFIPHTWTSILLVTTVLLTLIQLCFCDRECCRITFGDRGQRTMLWKSSNVSGNPELSTRMVEQH